MHKYILIQNLDPTAWEFYKKALAAFWTTSELDLSSDKYHWTNTLTPDEKHYITHCLAFFAASDGIVNENLAMHMYNLVDCPVKKAFYTAQLLIETIHAESYSLFITTLCPNDKIFENLDKFPFVVKKAQWALNWIGQDATLQERLVAFAAVEGIFFSGSFCAIYWLKKRNLMHGLCHANELISRDEGLHCDFACYVYSTLQDPLDSNVVHRIIREAVEIEREFVTDALPVKLLDMNVELMCDYIECCADRLLIALGYKGIFGKSNPFPWMEMISLEGKTSFFEKRPSQYQRVGVKSSQERIIDWNEEI